MAGWTVEKQIKCLQKLSLVKKKIKIEQKPELADFNKLGIATSISI